MFYSQDMVSMNQQLLDLMGVGHESLTRVCHICRSHELSCKLTGAGGGGCAFAVIRPGEVCVCVSVCACMCMGVCVCVHTCVCVVRRGKDILLHAITDL